MTINASVCFFFASALSTFLRLSLRFLIGTVFLSLFFSNPQTFAQSSSRALGSRRMDKNGQPDNRQAIEMAGHGQRSLSHFQVIGTHNSYHVAPGPFASACIAVAGKELAKGLEYTHPPLKEQLDMGLRQFELDLFRDPEGGRFATPELLRIPDGDRPLGIPAPKPLVDPEGWMNKPGTKVLHFPGFDFRTNVLTFTQALKQIESWSNDHPKHFPILLLLELKGTIRDWTDTALRELEQEVLNSVERVGLLTPDNVRGEYPDLRSAVLKDGWPSLDACRGKIILALDNTSTVRDQYLSPDPHIKQRLLFPSCPSDKHPSAAWFKINDPIGRFDRIRSLTSAGFLVRTRADANTTQARKNDFLRREKAFASGAQFISTDFPIANRTFSDYKVQFIRSKTRYLRLAHSLETTP